MDNNKLQMLDERIQKLKEQKKLLLRREKEKERKARTKRLIEVGAIFESRMKELGVTIKDKQQAEQLIDRVMSYIKKMKDNNNNSYVKE